MPNNTSDKDQANNDKPTETPQAPSDPKPENTEPKPGEMKSIVELVDTQTGVVGETGTAWTIRPDGSYRVEKLFNGKHVLKHKGVLNKDDMKQLEEVLRSVDMKTLATISSNDAVAANPRRMTLKMGDKQIKMVMSPMGAHAKTDSSRDQVEQQLIDAANAVDTLLAAPRED